jgi:hypothetical protein
MNDSANDILAQRLGALEKQVRWCKAFGFAIVAAIGLLFIVAARPGDPPREIRAQRFTVVDAFDNDVLDIWAAGRRAPTVTLYDQKGRPRTQLDLLPDGTSRLYLPMQTNGFASGSG